MRALAAILLVVGACGTATHSTRVGPMYAAADGSRAFVAVERWTTVTELVDDADGQPIRRDGLRDSTLFEIGLGDGAVTRRWHEDGWLSVYGFDVARDVVWLARDRGAAPAGGGAAPAATFGLDRSGAAVPTPFADFEMLGLRVAAAPLLASGRAVSLWDPVGGRQAALAGGWPFDASLTLDPSESSAYACRVDERSIFLERADLAGAFATGSTTAVTRELVVAPPAGDAFACAYSPDGALAAAVFLDRVDVFDAVSGARLRTIALPQKVFEVGATFAGDGLLVIPSFDRSATIVDLAAGTAATVEPGCCTGARRFPTTGAVAISGADAATGHDHGLLVAADGTITRLADSAAVHFARQTGFAPWPLPPPVTRIIPVTGADPDRAVLAAGVAAGRVVVQLATPARVLFRITLPPAT